MNLRRLFTVLPVLVLVSVPLASARAATPAPLVPAGWPKSLQITRIGIKAPIEALDLTKPAYVHAPLKWSDVSWYNRGPRPGDLGRATIYGHFDSTCCPAVFFKLRFLKAGDQIRVFYSKGRPVVFKVLWTGEFANNKLPMKFLYGATMERGLALLTCAGDFHRDGSGYDHKEVVYARVLLPNGKLG